jgi:hypothetical protein
MLAARTFGKKDDAPVYDLIGSNFAEAADETAQPPVKTVADGSDRID